MSNRSRRLATTAAIALIALAGCRTATTAFGNFPGESCADRASIRMIEVNYRSRQQAMAQRTPPVAKPDLVAVEGAEEIVVDPNGPGGNRRYCQGMAVFSDGSRETVYSSWHRAWEPNLVSGPGFSWCITEKPDRRCGRAIAPVLLDG